MKYGRVSALTLGVPGLRVRLAHGLVSPVVRENEHASLQVYYSLREITTLKNPVKSTTYRWR